MTANRKPPFISSKATAGVCPKATYESQLDLTGDDTNQSLSLLGRCRLSVLLADEIQLD